MSDTVAIVRAALLAAGLPDTVTEFAHGTHTAADAAAAIGCEVARIAKSIVFRAGDAPVLVIASGANRVDTGRLAAVLGTAVSNARPAFVLERTGYAVGGVPPIGHAGGLPTVLDADLLGLDPVWAAAGSARHVFRTSGTALQQLTGARVAAIAASG